MSAPFDILVTADGTAMLHPGLFGGDGVPDRPNPIISGDSQVNPDSVGTGDLTGSHNTPLHIGSFVVAAVVVVVALQILGFRFVVSAGIGA